MIDTIEADSDSPFGLFLRLMGEDSIEEVTGSDFGDNISAYDPWVESGSRMTIFGED